MAQLLQKLFLHIYFQAERVFEALSILLNIPSALCCSTTKVHHRAFVKQFVMANIKETSQVLITFVWWRECIGERWILLTQRDSNACFNLSWRKTFLRTCECMETWAPSQYPKRRLSVRSRKVSKSRDLYLELPDRSEIWQALRQHCCRCACQISKRYDNLKYKSRGFETSRDLTKRRLFGYWDGALKQSPAECAPPMVHGSWVWVYMKW